MEYSESESDSSSEEEVEVFITQPVSNLSPSPVVAPKIKPVNSLSAAMEAAVANVGVVDKSDTFETPVTSGVAAKTFAVNKPDSFGITYQPYKKKSAINKELNIDDDDNHEFNVSISQSQGTIPATEAVEEEDDEFEFDLEEDNSTAISFDNIMSRVELTEDHVIGEFVEDIPVSDAKGMVAEQTAVPVMINSMTGAMSLSVDNPEVSNNKNNTNNKESSYMSNTKDILNVSKSALNEIKDIYGSGLGDIEVSLLEMDMDSEANNKPIEMKSNNRLGGMVGIEEGDEDEEEEQEAEEQRQLVQLEVAKTALETEWENVNELRVGELASNPQSLAKPSVPIPFIPVTCEELTQHAVENCNLQQYKDMILLSDENSKGVGIFGLKPTPLVYNEEHGSGVTRDLHEFPYLMAQVDFEQNDEILLRTMQTIYVILMSSATGKTVQPPAGTGPHWENIGFQGQDPRTDVNRSMKMFAILQMLHLVSTYPKLACEWHQLSESYRTNGDGPVRTSAMDVSWPFMCVSIMFTKEVILAFRSGILNTKCNKHKDILYVLHDYHHALFYDFVRLLQTNPPSVHHAVHLAAIRKDASKTNSMSTSNGPLGILKRFKNFKIDMNNINNTNTKPSETDTSSISKPKKHSVSNTNTTSSTEKIDMNVISAFDDLDTLEIEDEKEKEMISDTDNSMWTNIIDSVKPKGKASKFIA